MMNSHASLERAPVLILLPPVGGSVGEVHQVTETLSRRSMDGDVAKPDRAIPVCRLLRCQEYRLLQREYGTYPPPQHTF